MKLAGVHHVAIQVADLARAEAFWCDLLGCAVLQRWLDDAGQPRSIWASVGGAAFLALERVPARGDVAPPFAHPSPGAHLVALRIARTDRAAWEARLSAAGVAIEKRSRYTLYVRDPDGTRIGLSHHPEPAE